MQNKYTFEQVRSAVVAVMDACERDDDGLNQMRACKTMDEMTATMQTLGFDYTEALEFILEAITCK